MERQQTREGESQTQAARGSMERRRDSLLNRLGQYPIDHPFKTLGIGAGIIMLGVAAAIAEIPIIVIGATVVGGLTWLAGLSGAVVRGTAELSGTYIKPQAKTPGRRVKA